MPTFSDNESGASVRSKINASINTVDGLNQGNNLLMTAAERTKLTGVEDGATADQTGAELVSSIDTELASTNWRNSTTSFNSTNYRFVTGGGAPASGRLTMNNAVMASVTVINISDENLDGNDIGAYLGTLLTAGSEIYVQRANDSAIYGHYSLNSDATDNVGYYSLSVTALSSAGTLSNNNDVFFTVRRGEDTGMTDAEVKTAYENNANTNAFTDAEQTKLAGIETGATADMTGSEIKTAYELQSNTNAFTDTLLSKLNGIEAGATADMTGGEIKTAYESVADTNAFTDTLLSKLNGIEAGATTDQTNSEIVAAVNTELGGTTWQSGGGSMTDAQVKIAYENNADTNAFTDADHSKLDGIEAGATADMTNGEIKTAYELNADTNAFTDADHSKLDGIEAGATNNAGALADLSTVDTAQIEDDAVTIAKLSATGTASNTTYLRGDGTWSTPASGGVTAEEAREAEVSSQTTTAYSLVSGDNGLTKQHNNASAITVTIPANATTALSVGFTVNNFQYGAGAVTITAASGVTLNGVVAGSGAIQTRYSGLVTLTKIATNEWIAFGDIATVA